MNQVALKIQRRRYFGEAVREIAIYQRLRKPTGACPEIINLREVLMHDGHVCMAFEKHGNSLGAALDRGLISPARARRATRQVLIALNQLHRSGYAHTDVKPDNILYSPRTGDARLADLGDAVERLRHGTLYGTREYTPPEVLLGAPLARSLDMWSVGCTVFEMLTAQVLFNPRAVAAKKYQEFNKAGGKDLPLAESVVQDRANEEAEQLPRGSIVANKYRLERALGCGRFSTVWLATTLSDVSLDTSREILRNNVRGGDARQRAQTERQRDERRWRKSKGAADLLDLALNYEHLLLMVALRGSFPLAMLRAGRFRASYFEEDDTPRFRPALRRVSLRARLRRSCKVRGPALDAVMDFLERCLTIDPSQRITAGAALAHPWIACS
jgi:serine/threonine protein kinase